jgi:hypothetical protein
MHRRHFLLPLAALAGAMLLAIEPAIAQDDDYPPAAPVLVAGVGTIVLGESVTIEGSGYVPAEDVEITVTIVAQAAPQLQESDSAETIAMVPVSRATSAQPPRIVRVAGDGRFAAAITPSRVGIARITATGLESGRSATVIVIVVVSADGLPETGTGGWRLVQVGGGAVALGSVLLLSLFGWRRRRDRTSA